MPRRDPMRHSLRFPHTVMSEAEGGARISCGKGEIDPGAGTTARVRNITAATNGTVMLTTLTCEGDVGLKGKSQDFIMVSETRVAGKMLKIMIKGMPGKLG